VLQYIEILKMKRDEALTLLNTHKTNLTKQFLITHNPQLFLQEILYSNK